MNKIVLMFALITMPFFSHADDWDETESCRVKLKDSFAIEAKYCDDCDTDDIKFYVRGKKDNTIELKEDVIYLKKEGNVNGNSKSVLYRLWSANDDVDGIFNEDEDHLDGDTVYTIRIEFNDIEKSGNSYTVNLSYFLYDGTTLLRTGFESRVEFDDLSNSSDVFFEQDEDLFDLNCRPSSRPEPNPEPEFSVPDNVCESFPEPIQGWKQSQSKLVVTNKEVRITGWSDEYLADSQNYYTYKQDWENGSEWSTLRIGFDKGGQAWQLYQNPDSKVCNDAMGCLPGDGVAGDGSLAGNDGLVESRKAQTPTPLAAAFNSGRVLVIRMKETDANFYGKVCLSESDACSFTESGGKVVIRLKRDLKSLDIKGYNTNKTVELQLDGKRVIERFSYDSGNDLSLYFSDNAELTVKTFINTGSNPKLIFGSNVTVNVVGTDQPPGSYLNKNADFALEGAYFDYRTYQKELTLPVIYGPKASFHFKTNSGQVFKGFILAKSIVLDTSEHMYGAITSLWLDMRGSSKVSKPDYSCSSIVPNEGDYSLELTPESAFSLICEDISPTVSVVSDGKLASDFNGTVVVSVDGVEQRYSGPINQFTIESGGASKVVSVNAYIASEKDSTLVYGEYKFVPFKFNVEDQYVIASKEKKTTVSALACISGKRVDVGYNGQPNVSFQWVAPSRGVGKLDFSPSLSDGSSTNALVLEDSGKATVTLEDDSFDCSGLDDCPIEGSGILKGQFTVYSRPWTFAICAADTRSMDGNITDSATSAFTSAGNAFELYVRPLRWVDGGHDSDPVGGRQDIETSAYCNSAVTQNFFSSANSLATNVELTHQVAQPSGGADGSLSGTLVHSNTEGQNNSYLSFSELSWSEVGVLRVNADTQADYLGMNVNLGYRDIGRFYPHHFKLDSNSWSAVDDQNDINYMGQPFTLAEIYISPYAKGWNTALKNYHSFDSSLVAAFGVAKDKDIDNQLILDTALGQWGESASHSQWSLSDDSAYVTKLVSPNGPFNTDDNNSEDSKFGLTISGEDPVKFYSSDDSETLLTQVLTNQPPVRFGRVNLDDVGGHQGDTLRIPLRVEYWSGSRFVQNVDDDGTVIYSDLDGYPKTIWSDDKSDCSILLEGHDTVTEGVTRELSARQDPNTCNLVGRQQSRLWLQLKGGSNNLPWLKYDWDNDGEEENPSSVVTFGIHRGNDRVIYRGEPGLTAQ
ncbi:hypothetical protein L3V31_19050 [Vibrio sp. J1-1]|uniref:DUF6701 domain-containing protein n=1 Tax=Vibrio sp. J1-1 TaxID=2912251 RepID=UPI001F16D3E1|nr:DUF6701 domain-containing protein [Vibrio sp. J1-1]MCF7483795.1 hypothetical protein [Vibrio sp. J1-1]